MYKGFDSEGFLEWMDSTVNGFDIGDFGKELLTNIIDYAHVHEHISKDQFAEFVAMLIPGIEFLDVAQFCDESILTNDTIHQLKDERTIKFYVECFDRDLIIELKYRHNRDLAEKMIKQAYETWHEECIDHMCCEEFICKILDVACIKYKWVNE